MTAKDIIFKSWNNHQLEEEEKRLRNIQKLIDYYNGDHKQYLKQYLKLKDLDDFPFYETGITKKIIKKLAEVYKTAPIRYFNSDRNDKYEKLTQRKNIRMKTIERQSRLLANVGVRPIVIEEKKGGRKFDYILLRSFTAYLDGLKPVAIKYLIQDNDEERYWEYWTDEVHLVLDSDNIPVNPIKAGYRENELRDFGDNPYGVIPYIWCHNDFIIDDFYNSGNCADDLVNANEQIDLMLSEMCHKYRYAAFNPIWGKGNIKNLDIQYGYNKILWIDDPEANIGTLNIDHAFADDIEAIKFQVDHINQIYGLKTQWAITGNVSGFSLIVQNIDHQDDLTNMQDVCRDWENDLLMMERIVGNVHGIKVPDKDFRIDYHEVQMPISIEEQNKKWKFEFDNNLSSRADYWRMQNPDITDKQIEERQKQIGEENKIVKEAEKTEHTIEELFVA